MPQPRASVARANAGHAPLGHGRGGASRGRWRGSGQNLGLFFLGVLPLMVSSFTGRLGLLVRLTGQDGQPLGFNRKQVAAAGLMAIRHVNSRIDALVPSATSLAPDFQLDYIMADTFSSPSVGQPAFPAC